MKRYLIAVCAMTTALASAAAVADSVGTRPIRLIVPYVPGGSTDTLARLLAPFFTQEFGQQTVVDNRGGGSSTIGTGIVAQATPDGHTIGLIDSAFVVNPSLLSKLPYDTLKDFTPIALVAHSPLIMLVNPKVPAKTVKELVALAHAQPGKLTFGSAGNGTAVHLAGEQLRTAAGIDILHVPYKGSGQSIIALLAGEVTMMSTVQSTAKPHVSAGRLRALAITSPKRTAVMPDVMTTAEAGYPGVDVMTSNGVVAAAGTSPQSVKRLNAVVVRALQDPGLQEKLRDLGFERAGGTPEQFGVWIRTEITKWAKVVKDSGARAAM